MYAKLFYGNGVLISIVISKYFSFVYRSIHTEVSATTHVTSVMESVTVWMAVMRKTVMSSVLRVNLNVTPKVSMQ